ncbi:MAG: hypothetical protein KC486_13975 [Myxococcales bacterium]|nr:hypothetical protein [Myxococcales bacterium]
MSETEDTRAPAASAAIEPAPSTAAVVTQPSRWGLVREFALFQGKLVVDGLKDLLLSPLSIVVLIIGLVSPRYAPAMWSWLYGVGRHLDGWIDLFPERLPVADATPDGLKTMDAVVGQVEELVRGLRRGGTTDPAVQERIDAVLMSINRLAPTSMPTPAVAPSVNAPPTAGPSAPPPSA